MEPVPSTPDPAELWLDERRGWHVVHRHFGPHASIDLLLATLQKPVPQRPIVQLDAESCGEFFDAVSICATDLELILNTASQHSLVSRA